MVQGLGGSEVKGSGILSLIMSHVGTARHICGSGVAKVYGQVKYAPKIGQMVIGGLRRV